ncbi:hypothetical protein NL676_029909 [Syzygium grande]|nr:hypothetical protein NL676_029909 [Syzygium grande]
MIGGLVQCAPMIMTLSGAKWNLSQAGMGARGYWFRQLHRKEEGQGLLEPLHLICSPKHTGEGKRRAEAGAEGGQFDLQHRQWPRACYCKGTEPGSTVDLRCVQPVLLNLVTDSTLFRSLISYRDRNGKEAGHAARGSAVVSIAMKPE